MTIFGGVGASLVVSAASGGKVYANNSISTTPQQVIAGNPSRTQITFHNPGTVDVFIAPTTVLNASGASAALNPNTTLLGGCFRVFANGGTLVVSGECQGAWQAFSATGLTNSLTIMDTNL